MKRQRNLVKQRELKSKILILCEGLTEKNYLNALKEDLKLPKTISINVFHSSKSDCNGVINEALKKIRNEDFSESYVLFDHDNQAKRSEAFKLASENNIKIIFSSICFEIWFLLHFRNSTKRYTSEEELEKELKKCEGMEKYEKNDFKHYLILKNKMEIAKSNVLEIRKTIINNYPGVNVCDLNPYTNIDELIQVMEKQK